MISRAVLRPGDLIDFVRPSPALDSIVLFRHPNVMGCAASSLEPLYLERSTPDRHQTPQPRQRAATLIGGSAVAVWATAASLATIGAGLGPLPFVAGSLACGFFTLLLARLLRGQPILPMLAVPLPALSLMVLGFFGHNALFMSALRFAPAGEVTVVSYLWPLLMVAFQGLFAMARPSRLQWIGTALGFVGFCVFAWPALSGGTAAAVDGSLMLGLLLALSSTLPICDSGHRRRGDQVQVQKTGSLAMNSRASSRGRMIPPSGAASAHRSR